MKDQQVARSVVLPASVDEVWEALTDARILSTWLGGSVEIDPRPSGAISLDDGSNVRNGAIDTFVENERISFIWYVDEDEPTEVIFEVEAADDRTVLRVVERPFVWEFDTIDPSWVDGRPSSLLAGIR
jgi:uncharacterized protein YndB with AHSA1/START domain